MEELHPGNDAIEGSKLPVAIDGRLSEQQVGPAEEGQQTSRGCLVV